MNNYEAPKLDRFGTFRDLTLVGAAGSDDVISVAGSVSGCNGTGADPDDCTRTS